MANGAAPPIPRAAEDAPEERLEGLARFYGTTPTTYEAISERSREHTRGATADPNASGWLPLGPRNVGGAVRCIAQNPASPAELLAGSAQAGVWKSTNDGYSWRAVGGPDLFGSVCAIAFARSDPRRVYAATGELSYNYPGGIGFFRSTDGGDTFARMVDARQRDPGSAPNYARIVVDPADATRAWIASSTGLWRLEGNAFRAEALPGAAGVAVTDVAVTPDPANANQYIVLAGVSGIGVARGVFNRKNRSTAWTVVGPAAPAPWSAGVGVVRVAWSASTPAVAYAVMEQQPGVAALNNFPSVLYRSTDLGVSWAATSAATMETESAIAWYVLALAVNPRNPAHVVGGCVNVRNTIDGGVNWTTLLDWTRYDAGDRTQHADQSEIVFDARRPNAVWVANDGGISFCADITAAPPVWRKRSYGISAAQLFDLTTHGRFPGMCGGGMQDNGTFVSYGGPTWYRLSGGDGGALGFHPTSPFRFYTSNQVGIDRADVSQFPPSGVPVPRPQHASDLPDVAPPANVHAPFRFRLQGVAPPGGFFMRALEAHPTNPDFVLLGAAGAAQYATDGVTFVSANTPGILGNITAAAFAAIGTDMWVGSDQGEVFVNGAALPASSAAAPQPAWTRFVPAAAAVTAIAVHPQDARIVAIATALGGGGLPAGIFLSHDRGVHWDSIIGAAGALPPSPYLALAFDPSTMGTLFAGTLSGVYVTRDLPAVPLVPGSVPNPTWRTFNAGLPLVPVTDLLISPVTRTLRCATFGRGAFECSLTGATPAEFVLPAVSLVVRNHAADDGRTYDALNAIGGDPRIGTAAAPAAPPPPPPAATPAAAGPIVVTRSPDIRVDSPRFTRSEAFAFGEAIDGAEFDEVLVRDEPLVGDTNIVYVQVQNRGTASATNVDVHLFFADAGTPPASPDIPADLGFPNDPPAGSPWQRADTITVGEIRSGEPAVVSFRWTPPLAIREHVALLAVVTNAADLLAAIPAGPVEPLVRAERRAAVHVTHVQRDTIFIRDGLDDTGERGAIPWGGRSPDIIVRQSQVAAADFATEFVNRAAAHAADRVRAGQNFIYVRVNNRTRVAVPHSTVRLFQVPRSAIATPGVGWTNVAPAAGVIINGIAAGGWGIAEFPFTPAAPDPDPDGGADGKGVIFLAMANVIDGTGREVDPFPELGDITDVATFWRFFTGAPLASNAAIRAIRFAS